MKKAFAQVGVTDFFRLFMSDPSRKALHDVFKAVTLDDIGNLDDLPTTEKEEQMYEPLCKTIHTLLQRIYSHKDVNVAAKTKIGINETADVKEVKAAELDLKPDLSFFHREIREAVEDFQRSLPDNTNTKKAQEGDREHFKGRTSWSWIVSFIEVKSNAQWLPFGIDEDPEDFSKGISNEPIALDDVHVTSLVLPSTPSSRSARSQIIKYVSEIQLRQPREFVLCAHICQDRIRFMRWDRTGAVVSKAVSYIKYPRVLLEFVYRLATAGRSGQGYDTSATHIDAYRVDRDLRMFIKTAKESEATKWQVPYIDDMKAMNANGLPVYEIVCRGLNDVPGTEGSLRLWIGRYYRGSRSPTGRGTKTYIAFDVTNERLVFVKDYWCARHPSVHPELEVYQLLHDKNVRHVAHALGGGVVLDDTDQEQVTLTEKFLKMIYTTVPSPSERFHYRVVLLEVGHPLETYEDSASLISAVYGAFLGHEQAWRLAGVLHRDISPGNIIITQDGEGLLIDWDLCKYKDELNQVASQHGRSGTWPFMSALLLCFPLKPNDLADDLEGFVHVLCFMALRYHLHDLSARASPDGSFDPTKNSKNTDLASYLKRTFFESSTARGETTIGGGEKRAQILAGTPDFVLDPQSSHLGPLITQLYGLLKSHYGRIDWVKARLEWYPPAIPGPQSSAQRNPGALKPVRRYPLDEDPFRPKKPLPPPFIPPNESRQETTSSSPLAAHDAMKIVFLTCMDNLPSYTNADKTMDQFLDLPDPDAPDGHKLLSQDTVSSSFRAISRASSAQAN